MGVLAVQVDQARADIGQRAGCRHPAVEVRTRPTVRRHDPSEHDLRHVLPRRRASRRPLRRCVLRLRHREAPLHNGLPRSSTDAHPLSAPAHKELDRVDDEGLAGAGLARYGRHAGAEDEREILYHPQFPHPELAQHGTARSPASGR